MKRKVAQIGPSTLMISLPTKWVKENNIRKGDELEVFPEKSIISFSTERKLKEKEITIDTNGFNKYMLIRNLDVCYISGYKKIILVHNQDKIYSDQSNKEYNIKKIISSLINRFIGMEIVSQTQTQSELKCFILEKDQDIKKIEKRIYFLFKEATNEFFNLLNGDIKNLVDDVYNQHDTISKFIAYFLRIVDLSDLKQEEKNLFYTLYLKIDMLVDKFRHIADMVKEYGITTQVKNILKKIFEILFDLFASLHKRELNKEIIEKRYKIVHEIRSTKYTIKEYRVIAEAIIFLDVMNDFSRALIVSKIKQTI